MATCGGEVFPSDRTFPGPYLTRQNPMPFPPDRTFPGPYLTRLSSLPDRTRNAACNNATVLLLSTVAWEAHRGLRPRGGMPRVGRRRRVRRSRGVAMSARIDALVFLLILT